MPDSLSLVAIGASVGGVAGKFAEKAWETAERWLAAKFDGHAEAAQTEARRNAASFIAELAERVSKLEASGLVQEDSTAAAQRHPQFAASLQHALLCAAKTDSADKHALLADMVASRMVSESESIVALATQMACDAIALCTPRQLRLLALCSFLEGVRPRWKPEDCSVWLDSNLRHFAELEFHEIDAKHLVALSCATFDQRSEKDLSVLLCMKLSIVDKYDESPFENSEYFELLQMQWDNGLAGVELTSVGTVVGALAFDRITGSRTGLPEL